MQSLTRASGRALMMVLALVALPGCSERRRQAASAEAPLNTPLVYPTTDYVETAPGRPGGTLRVSTFRDPATLDFQVTTETNAKWMGRLIYDNLVYLDDKGGITPWLAKSWDISPDGKTYTFHLRDDVTFSDGTKFDAEALRVNLARIRDPATKAAMTTAYIAPYVDGKVIGPYTFEAHLSRPYSAFLNVLAQSWFGLESPKALKEHPKELGDHPVGSGPFTVQSYTRQRGVVLVKRKDYDWSPDFIHHHGPAYLDRIQVDFVPEALTRYTSLAGGQYDFTIDAPAQNAAAIRADPDLVFVSRVNLGNPYRAITFNVTQPPFSDVEVRRAFAKAVDRKSITQAVGFGEIRPTTGFLSATTPYFDPSAGAAVSYDPAEANRILDADGWKGRDAQGFRTKDGKRLAAQVTVSESALSGAVLVALQADARKIGLQLTIRQVTLPELVQIRADNSYQAFGPGIWHTNTPDGLYIVYGGGQITSPRFTGQNISRLDDSVLDDLLLQARATLDPARLKTLYAQAQHRLAEVVPAVPLYENHSMMAYHRYVHGVVFDTSHNTPDFITAWLDKP